jgi:hypothetical protein
MPDAPEQHPLDHFGAVLGRDLGWLLAWGREERYHMSGLVGRTKVEFAPREFVAGNVTFDALNNAAVMGDGERRTGLEAVLSPSLKDKGGNELSFVFRQAMDVIALLETVHTLSGLPHEFYGLLRGAEALVQGLPPERTEPDLGAICELKDKAALAWAITHFNDDVYREALAGAKRAKSPENAAGDDDEGADEAGSEVDPAILLWMGQQEAKAILKDSAPRLQKEGAGGVVDLCCATFSVTRKVARAAFAQAVPKWRQRTRGGTQ